MVLSFAHCRIKAVDTVAVIHPPICNKWEQNPEYEKVLSSTYPIEPKIKDTKDHDRLSCGGS
jgi:hypothetical protein